VEEERILKHKRTGRPLGSDHLMGRNERVLGGVLKRQKPGPNPNRGAVKGTRVTAAVVTDGG